MKYVWIALDYGMVCYTIVNYTILRYSELYYTYTILHCTILDSCTLFQGTNQLRDGQAKSHQKCKIVAAFELQEAEMCDRFICLYVSSKNGTVPTQPCMRGPATKVKFQRELREGSGEHI